MSRSRRAARIALATIIVLGAGVPAASAFTVGQGASGDTVPLVRGETLRVKLRPADSGSTGYHWRVATKPNRTVLRLLSSRPASDGTGQVFTYRARRPGVAISKLQYVSPSRGARATKTFRLEAVVNARAPRFGCSPAGAITVAQSGLARVFMVTSSTILVDRDRRGAATGRWGRLSYEVFYGCEFSQKRAYPLHYRLARRPGYSGIDEFANLTLRGTVVGYVFTAGCPFAPGFDGGCPFGGSSRQQPIVESQDLHTGNLIRSIPAGSGPGPVNKVTALVMSPSGGLAWIERPDYLPEETRDRVLRSDDIPAKVEENGYSVPDTLDAADPGIIDLDSLTFDGTEVAWSRSGEWRRAPLR